MKNKFWLILLLLCLFGIFIGTRLVPLQNHTTAYTYDQGRDFLKAAEIVDSHDLTFLGPTTGIIGVYHGAWWYYFLSLPYAFFQGEPIGFYQFNLLIQTLTLLIATVFVIFEAGVLVGLLTALLIIAAPYFLHNSLFVANNIMAAPNFLFLLLALYYLAKKPKNARSIMLFCGLFFGFVAEFELSFGIFLVPSFVLTVLLFPVLRRQFINLGNLLFFLGGAFLAFLPRILFEVRHNFSQTKVLLSFFLQPKLNNSKAYWDILRERLSLFKIYYQSLFSQPWIMWLVTLTSLGTLIFFLYKKRIPLYFQIWSFLLLTLFTLSTLYKGTFWDNYYEGIQYLLLFLAVFPLSFSKKSTMNSVFVFLLVFFLFTTLLTKTLKQKPTLQPVGLAASEKIVNYLYQQNKHDFCVDIYTPPAIPYTYRYLFHHENRKHHRTLPTDTWTNNQCWYILEPDQYPERRQSWIDTRIPKDAHLVKKTEIAGVNLELWRK